MSSSQRTPLIDVVRPLRRPQLRLGATLAKLTSVSAAGGLAIALAIPGGPASATDSTIESADSVIAARAATLLDQRAEQQVSRTVVRAAAPAVALQAPAAAAPVAAPEFGAMSFTAVEKPPPPPPPPAPTPTRSSGPTGSSAPSGGGSSGGGSSAQEVSGGSGLNWDAANGCSCARGLTQSSLRVLAAVKFSFPSMTNIGGVRPDSMPDHPSGRALDFMTTDRGYGDSIAAMLIGRAGELNIEYIIWRQRIWMPGSGWKTMSDRGSASANHYDHVHVTVR